MTVFRKIIDRKVKVDIVYEDEFCLAVHDNEPQAPVHIVLFPKKEIMSLAMSDAGDQSLLGHLLLKASEIANAQGLADDGYRVVTNIGRNGNQTVSYLHFHILGGRKMEWPPG